MGKRHGQRHIVEHHGSAHSEAHSEAQPAALVEIACGSRTSARIAPNFEWDRSRALTGAGAGFNHRRRARFADVVESNRLGVTVIDNAVLAQ